MSNKLKKNVNLDYKSCEKNILHSFFEKKYVLNKEGKSSDFSEC